MTKLFLGISIFLFTLPASFANVKLPKLVGDNMVLQRDKPIQIWGWAQKGEKVTVKISTLAASTVTASNGKWALRLPAIHAGGPFDMTIKGNNTIILKNILVGDVWLCAGEINMEYPIARYGYAEEEINQANFPDIRLFNVHTDMSPKPKDDLLIGSWLPAVKENIGDFSALAYFLGRDLHNRLKVPIGLISATWAGTLAESWMSPEAINKFPEFKPQVDEVLSNKPLLSQSEKWERERDRLEQERKMKIAIAMDPEDAGLKNGKPDWENQFFKNDDWVNTKLPGRWEEKDIPNFDGTVWYRKDFLLPDNLISKELILNLGPIDDMDYAYVNGTMVGSAYTYNAAREYKLPAKLLKPGKNTVYVRVIDLGGGGGFWANQGQMGILTASDKKMLLPLEGDWQYKTAFQSSEGWVNKLNIPAVMVSGGAEAEKYTSYAYPSLMFNGMIKPLTSFGIKGVIWYQGESNVGKAIQYKTLFPALIQDWRTQWGMNDLPFLFVQLSKFTQGGALEGSGDWAALREAQTEALSLPNTGMVTAIDLGKAGEIGSPDKRVLGARLAAAASTVAYGQNISSTSPVYESMTKEGNKIRIKFKNSASGLTAKNKYGYPKGFIIAGEDKKFVIAKAVIENNTILVYSDEIKSPVAVRYAWTDNPADANLYNKENQPVFPFRTDNWPATTSGK